MNAPHVAVVATYSGGAAKRVADLSRSLGSMGRHVIVVANSREIEKELSNIDLDPTVHVITAGTNLGFGGAVNYGLDRVFSTVLIVNDDVVLDDQFSSLCADSVNLLRTDLSIGAVSFVDYKPRRRVRRIPSSVGVILRVAGLWSLAKRLGSTQLEFYCVLVDWVAWEKVGGFDSLHFPLYFEDADFVDRLQKSGLEMAVVQAPIHHAGSQTSRSHPEVAVLQSIGAFNFLVRNRGWHWSSASTAIRIAQLIGTLVSAVRRRPDEARHRMSVARAPLTEARTELPPYEVASASDLE